MGRGNRVVLTAMVSLQVRYKHWLPCVRLVSLLFRCHVIASTRTRRTQLTRSLFNPFTELLGLNLHSLMRQVCLILYIILSLFSFNNTLSYLNKKFHSRKIVISSTLFFTCHHNHITLIVHEYHNIL